LLREVEVLRPLALIGVSCVCVVAASFVEGCKQSSTDAPAAHVEAGSDGSVPLAHVPPSRSSHDEDSTALPEGWEPAIALAFRGGPAAGRVDYSNQYASTIMLLEAARHVYANCSGVLLNPRVVLTAASCVCPPRRATEQGAAETGPIGPSACAERAFMGRVWYSFREGQPSKEKPASLKMRRFEGTVRIHPAFKLELDEKGAVASTEADLALIVLDSPVAESLPFVPFADTEVQEGEMLVMAGYGDELRFRDEPYLRYFRRNKVTQVQGRSDGKVLYEQQGAFVYNGYTGGPCFREDKSQRWLVGIASVGSEKELAFTSTYFFRDWLRAELQRVGATDSAATPAPQLPQ
jgi:hypothetical protein